MLDGNKTIRVTVETVPDAQSHWIGYPLLFAYAPNGAPDRINVSPVIPPDVRKGR